MFFFSNYAVYKLQFVSTALCLPVPASSPSTESNNMAQEQHQHSAVNNNEAAASAVQPRQLGKSTFSIVDGFFFSLAYCDF